MSFFKNILKKVGLVKENEEKTQETKLSPAQKIQNTAFEIENIKASIDKTINVDHEYLAELEEDLIKSDLGVELALEYSEIVEKKYLGKEILESILVQELKDFLLSSLDDVDQLIKPNKKQKNIYLIVGVNGVGKTTSIGKLANKFRIEAFKTLIAAGDTFRAAAEAQLELWAKRAQVDILQLEDGAKASAVVYKAIEKIKAEDFNMLLIDTAGRLQNKADLMAELKKLKDVIEKNMSGFDYVLKTLLVLDATTGSNALSQARNFDEVTKLDGIILTKFDGSARAGVIFSLARKFKLPVYYVGTGEGIEDISDFDLDKFIKKYL